MYLIDPIKVLEERNISDLLLMGSKDVKIDILKSNKGFVIGNRVGYSRIIDIKGDQKKANLIYAKLLSCIYKLFDEEQYKISAYLLPKLGLLNDFISLRPEISFAPSLFDLYLIKQALDEYKPDLIIEIGGGVSSVLFADYVKSNGRKYIMIDGLNDWALNTIKCLEKCDLPKPLYKELDQIYKKMPVEVYLNCFSEKRGLEYPDFSYDEELILSNVKKSNRTLVFIDGSANGSLFQGAEFVFDPQLFSALSDALILVDCRPKAVNILNSITKISRIFSTNTAIIINENDLTTLDVGSSIYFKNSLNEASSIYPLEQFAFSIFRKKL